MMMLLGVGLAEGLTFEGRIGRRKVVLWLLRMTELILIELRIVLVEDVHLIRLRVESSGREVGLRLLLHHAFRLVRLHGRAKGV